MRQAPHVPVPVPEGLVECESMSQAEIWAGKWIRVSPDTVWAVAAAVAPTGGAGWWSFRQLLHRGMAKARCEFSLICTGHHILKRFRSAASGQFDPAWARDRVLVRPVGAAGVRV